MSRWQDALKKVEVLQGLDSLQPEKSAVSEELNLAWARHEIISDHVDEVSSLSLSLCGHEVYSGSTARLAGDVIKN